jgi:hypothetical protein
MTSRLRDVCPRSPPPRHRAEPQFVIDDSEAWTHEIPVADSILALPEIGINLPLAECYDGIAFEVGQEGDQASDSDRA